VYLVIFWHLLGNQSWSPVHIKNERRATRRRSAIFEIFHLTWDAHLAICLTLHCTALPNDVTLVEFHQSQCPFNTLNGSETTIVFYLQNGICAQKYPFWPNNDGEKWSRKNILKSLHVGRWLLSAMSRARASRDLNKLFCFVKLGCLSVFWFVCHNFGLFARILVCFPII
jgi:hypothetical protein